MPAPHQQSPADGEVPEELDVEADRASMRRASRSHSPSAAPSDLAHPRSRIAIEWRNLGYTLPVRQSPWHVLRRRHREAEPRIVLSGLHGFVSPGQVLCVIGPPGSGKSAFLLLLAGRITGGTMTGALLVNGRQRGPAWRRVVAFVEQDTGYLDARLTVRELVQYYADLTIPKRYDKEEKEARITHVLRRMHIEHLLDARIGGDGVKGIAEGERKRLAIALELLQEPKVLLLDEPTSGLDSRIAADVARYLQQLALVDDLTVIMTAMRPRMQVISRCANIMLMAKGSAMFIGSVEGAVRFYAENGLVCPEYEDPIAFLVGPLEDRDMAARLLRSNDQSQQPHILSASPSVISAAPSDDTSLPQTHHHNLSRLTELKTVTLRYFRLARRDTHFFWPTQALILLASLMAMVTYFQMPQDEGYGAVRNRLGFFKFVVFDGLVIAGMTALLHEHQYAVRRERYRSIARASAYYWAFFLIQFPLWIFLLLATIIAVYYVCGLRYTPFTALLVFLAFDLLVTLQAVAMGILFAAGISTIQMAVALGALYLVLVHLYNGITVNTENMTWVLRWIRYLSPMYYSVSGMAQNEFNGQVFYGEPGEHWLQEYGIDGVSVMWCAGALMIITVFTISLGLFVFIRKSRPVLSLD